MSDHSQPITPAIQRILDILKSFEGPNVFNPWRQQDPLDLLEGAAEARRQRLAAHFSCSPLFLLVGEAPGYQGCHYSGSAFTNEKLILEGRIPRVSSAFRLTTRPRPWCEPSATIVWGQLHELGIADRVVLWNAFAWHPHQPDNLLSNRTPTPTELQAGLPALEAVISHFSGVPVVPIGQVSARTLGKLGVKCLPSVRHPAMGGANAFRAGLSEVVNTALGLVRS